ncbi:hypothetical protein NCCP691_34620 [Noviherbaspirillum aridicola]|uniref:Uncharacterized protein n=1 Tax=Noviherbaspirillum aridicola TaxID=2849687 RepID=A0ABQ4Q8B0_9BURK|nr:hypothetical protein NCCP691_34620 [Noviherbaspirillum aridicola]
MVVARDQFRHQPAFQADFASRQRAGPLAGKQNAAVRAKTKNRITGGFHEAVYLGRAQLLAVSANGKHVKWVKGRAAYPD